MDSFSKARLLDYLGRRYDYYSSQVVLREASQEAGVKEKDAYTQDEILALCKAIEARGSKQDADMLTRIRTWAGIQPPELVAEPAAPPAPAVAAPAPAPVPVETAPMVVEAAPVAAPPAEPEPSKVPGVDEPIAQPEVAGVAHAQALAEPEGQPDEPAPAHQEPHTEPASVAPLTPSPAPQGAEGPGTEEPAQEQLLDPGVVEPIVPELPEVGVERVEIAIEVHEGPEAEGNRVVVVGEGEYLGDWDPSRGILLEADAQGIWRGNVVLAPSAELDYKLVIVPEVGAPVWEPGGNRHFLVPASATAQLRAEWRTPVAK